MITRRAPSRSGFALIEVLVAVLFLAIFLLALLQVRNQALHQFLMSGDQHTGAWLAEMKMAEVISENLPDPEDEDTWVTFESGDFAYLDDRNNDINRSVNEEYSDRTIFANVEWECTKELIFVGPDFIGNREDLDAWEEPLDENGEPTGDADPTSKAAARIVRVTLTVFLPAPKRGSMQETETGERPTVKLVTYVDPSILFDAQPATDETVPEGTGG